MNRRQFCHRMAAVGGTLALSPLIGACSQSNPQPTHFPTPTPPPIPTVYPTAQVNTPGPASPPAPSAQPSLTATGGTEASVVLVKTTDRAAGVRRALELLAINPASGREVFLKPNFNSADSAPGSTHGDILRQLVISLTDMGANQITIGDRSGMGSTRTVMEQKGVFGLADEFGLGTVVFDDLAGDDWVLQTDADYHWSGGFAVPRLLLDSECVVQTCNLKTHQYGGHFTLSLKNSVGFAAKNYGGKNYMNELHNSAYQREMIAEINMAYRPALIVMDGVQAFVDGGPHQGTLADTQVILAGTDRVAVDAVGVAILRLFGTTPEVSAGRVFEQAQIRRAVELGLGVGSPEQIGFITGDEESTAYAAQIRQILVT